jgi:hypothetical protein
MKTKLFKMRLLQSIPWNSVYEDNNEESQDQNIGQTGNQNNNQSGNQNQNQGGTGQTTFSQDDVNRFLAEDRRKHKASTEKLISELETIKKSKNLSEQERNNLTQRIDELQNQLLTKDQLLEKERTKLQNEHRTQLQRESEEKETWRNRYTQSTIERSIVDAAIEADSFSPEQIVALLKSNTKLVEETDNEGNGLGIYVPRVKFNDTDKEGKPVVLDLSVREAVKRMKDLPEKYGNLFKANVTGGLGGNGSVGVTRPIDPSKIRSVEDYQKLRFRLTGRGKSK